MLEEREPPLVSGSGGGLYIICIVRLTSFAPGVGLRPRLACCEAHRKTPQDRVSLGSEPKWDSPSLTCWSDVAQVFTEAAVLYSSAASSAILLRTKHSSDEMRFKTSLASCSASRDLGSLRRIKVWYCRQAVSMRRQPRQRQR